ncbi:polysaccharide biosynthesis protein [bacterium]|nr:MAG: polysaccharide biosynthesis protein [bacterium]
MNIEDQSSPSLIKVSYLIRNRYFFLLDLFLFALTPVFAVAIRHDWIVDFPRIQADLVTIILMFGAVKLLLFFVGGLYQQMWQHASVDELAKIGLLGLLVIGGNVLSYSALMMVHPSLVSSIPRSVPFIDGVLTLLVVGGLRFSVRVFERLSTNASGTRSGTSVLVVGAGDAGVMLAGEMQANPQMGLRPIGFVDDDPHKAGMRIRGIKVLGNRSDIVELVTDHKIGQIVIAMPTASGKIIRELNDICKQTGVKTRIIPGVFELLDGSVNISKLRNVAIEDLLRREAVSIDDTSIRGQIEGRRVLVTGAGGSIGSELCRQIARFGPAQLILLGHGENSIFSIANELSYSSSEIALSPFIADVRDRQRLSVMMKRYKPELVFHAAAHKHVSLMELNPSEAVTNNIVGTQNVVEVSSEHNVERFVLISTDKAVNPTSVMGATKRVAELIVQDVAYRSQKAYVAVRFGNVLGSSGSVIPIFREQIARGGPITLTHPEVRRYFMTIPEAVQLVLQAGSMAAAGGVYMLDMGEPVKIADLAADLIRLSGLEIHKDIEITYTGLRQGEKLFEELLLDDEHFVRTNHEKIFVLKNGKPGSGTASNNGNTIKTLQGYLELLRHHAAEGNKDEIRPCLKKLVPEFHYQVPDISI